MNCHGLTVVATALFLIFTACFLRGDNKVLAELRFVPSHRADKTAGVWVDGQYMGYVKELKGDKKILLLAGKHEIVVHQPWYADYVEQPFLEPGEVHKIRISLVRDGRKLPAQATAELKVSAVPSRAAVFVDDQFAGHVDEFNGPGEALLLTPGQHHVKIALPGYLPFDSTVHVRPKQKLKIETKLAKGSISEAGSHVNKVSE